MHTLHDRPDLIPGSAGLPISNTHQEQGEKADEDKGLNAIVFPAINGPELKSGLERPECPLHFQELRVSQGIILGNERVIERDAGQGILSLTFRCVPGVERHSPLQGTLSVPAKASQAHLGGQA